MCVYYITGSYKHFTTINTFKIHLNPYECTHVGSIYVANDRVPCPLHFLLPSKTYLVLITETPLKAVGKGWEMGKAKNWRSYCVRL